MTRKFDRRGISSSLFGTSAAVLLAMASHAQVAAQSEEDTEIEEIIVTGSRIARAADFDSVTPIVSISAAELENRGFTNVADALNEIPGFSPGLGPSNLTEQNTFAAGVNFANRFGLGTQRTLTLVNSKRFVSSNPPSIQGTAGGVQVDLNVIPVALVERIENVDVGGAPIYGSDAIAGTINVIMKDDFQGLEVQAQYGTIGKNGGDPESYQAQAVWGGNLSDGRGNVAFGVDYVRSESAVAEDFPDIFGANPFFEEVDGVFRIFNDERLLIVGPPGRPIITPTPFAVPNGPPLGFTQEEADALTNFPNASGPVMINEVGDLIPFDTGTFIPGNGIFTSGGNGLDLDLFGNEPFGNGNVSTKSERITSMAIGHYDINDWLTAFGQINFANTENLRPIVQDEHQTFAFGGSTFTLGLPITTPFLKESTRQELIALGAGDTIFVSRNLNDVSDNGRSFSEAFTWRVVGGLRGDFEFLDRQWNFEASVNWGQSDIDSNEIGINDGRYFNAVDAIRLTQDDIQSIVNADNGIDSLEDALGALNTFSGTSDPGVGDVICRAVLERARGDLDLRGDPAGSAVSDVLPDVDGCVPLNILGAAGPQEALEFVRAENIFQSDLNQRVFTLSLAGEVVELPAGWIEVVAGYETRRERGSFGSNEGVQIGLGREDPILPTSGAFSTDEIFFELLTPVVSPDTGFGEDLVGFRLIDRLSIEAAARIVDNSIAGSDVTWTAGGRIAFGGVFSDLAIRGNYTRSVRSPSITELFAPRTATNEFAEDPCDFQFLDDGPVPQNRQANCAAIGLGPDFRSLAVNASREGVTGGNPDLSNEKADSFSVGGIYTPRWVPGFTVSTDLIQINITDRITSLELTDLLEACFDQDPADFDLGQPPCTAFERDAAGQIIDFQTGFQNAAFSRFKGISMQALYQFDLARGLSVFSSNLAQRNWGQMDIRARAFHRIRNRFSVIGEEASKVVGSFFEPKWSGTFDFNWTYGPARVFWRVEWQDDAEFDPNGDNFFEAPNGKIVQDTGRFRIINDVALSYNFYDYFTALVTIDNVLNRKPNTLELARTEFSPAAIGIDELFGRQFRFRLTARL